MAASDSAIRTSRARSAGTSTAFIQRRAAARTSSSCGATAATSTTSSGHPPAGAITRAPVGRADARGEEVAERSGRCYHAMARGSSLLPLADDQHVLPQRAPPDGVPNLRRSPDGPNEALRSVFGRSRASGYRPFSASVVPSLAERSVPPVVGLPPPATGGTRVRAPQPTFSPATTGAATMLVDDHGRRATVDVHDQVGQAGEARAAPLGLARQQRRRLLPERRSVRRGTEAGRHRCDRGAQPHDGDPGLEQGGDAARGRPPCWRRRRRPPGLAGGERGQEVLRPPAGASRPPRRGGEVGDRDPARVPLDVGVAVVEADAERWAAKRRPIVVFPVAISPISTTVAGPAGTGALHGAGAIS